MAKNHLPGYINLVNNTVVSWVPVLFPYLDRNDLWVGSSAVAGWRSGAGATPRVGVLVCPDDSSAAGTASARTYTVNLGVYQTAPTSVNGSRDVSFSGAIQPTSTSPGGLGVFRDYSGGSASAISLSSVTSGTRTLLLAERAFVNPATAAREWLLSTPSAAWMPRMSVNEEATYGFSWPDYPALPLPVGQPTDPTTVLSNIMLGVPYVSGTTSYWPPLSSPHPGIVIVTFCDGHVESLPDTTLCYNDPDNPAIYVLP